MSYNFKTLKVVLPAKELINVILSKTQRKTPTVVHPGYSISRIRAFYQRKIKFTQESVQEKLTEILQSFPKLDEIHPFYGDLINVLYDKDHYKLALGHIHSCKNLIDNISTDYLKLLKYADSLYRCKMLKKAALGRMMTGLKKLTASLNYLEQVRLHLSRLPQINPYERTLLITGYPNVGKSSFINKITKANVEVQAYPFTTKSLYIGHTEYNHIRHQVIDTPGLLDQPLESRNTVEMQSITALAHLKACILFFIDISETCSYSINQQIELYQSLKPLFKNKPVVLVLTKVDLIKLDQLTEQNKQLILQLSQSDNLQIIELSTKSEFGINDVKQNSCIILEQFRKAQLPEQISGGNNQIQHDENVNRGIYIANPTNPKSKAPEVFIPQEVLINGKSKINRPTLKQIADENGGAGVFTFPIQEHFMLKNENWKYDCIPEIMDGKNIKDYVDEDILQRLAELEEEERILEQNEAMSEEEDLEQVEFEKEEKKIHLKIGLKKQQHKITLKNHVHKQKQNLSEVVQDLENKNIETEHLKNRVRSKSKVKTLKQRISEQAREDDSDNEMQLELHEDQAIKRKLNKKQHSQSRSRSKGYIPKKNIDDVIFIYQKKTIKIKRRNDKKWNGMAGEADKSIAMMKPRHLFSGKRSNGSNDRR